MKLNKKGFFYHPIFLFVLGLIIGTVLMYLAIKGIIPIKVCP